MQRALTERGLYNDKIDGKAGMLTRAALGRYQKANGLKLDCWPTAAVLDHMRRARPDNRDRDEPAVAADNSGASAPCSGKTR